MNEDFKGKILSLLAKKPKGLTILEIAASVGINRATASKYLLVLETEQKVNVREIGRARVHYINQNTLKKILEEEHG
jgi:DNA-binding IclR family transcriptional regulator